MISQIWQAFPDRRVLYSPARIVGLALAD
jgi:hypothetical protein